MIRPNPVRIIVNPISGLGYDGRFLAGLRERLDLHGFPVEVHRTEGPGHARRLAARTPDATSCLVSIGGDGTHREVIAGLIGRPVPVCIVPSGTENVLAKTLGLGGTVRETTLVIVGGRWVAMDVGLANGEPFAMFAGVGLDAAIVRRVQEKRRGGPVRRAWYYGVIARMIWAYEFPRLAITVDGRTLCDDAGVVVVGNLPQYADRMRVVAPAIGDDGLLDVVGFRTQSAAALLAHYARVKAIAHLQHRKVVWGRGQRITVAARGKQVDVELDGDWLGLTPLDCTVRPRAVRILVRPRRGR